MLRHSTTANKLQNNHISTGGTIQTANTQNRQLHLYLYLKFLKRNLLMWRHFEMSSSLLLRIEDSVFRIMSFSDKHKSHFLDPMRKGKLLCKIEKLTWHSAPCDFCSQTYLDSSVLSLYAGYLKDDLWSLYLCLKFSLKPMYRPSPPTFVDTTP